MKGQNLFFFFFFQANAQHYHLFLFILIHFLYKIVLLSESSSTCETCVDTEIVDFWHLATVVLRLEKAQTSRDFIYSWFSTSVSVNFHNFIPSFTFLYAKLELTFNQRLSHVGRIWSGMKLLRWAWLDLLIKAYFLNKAMWCVPFRTFTLSFQVVFKESCPVTRDHMHYPESLNLLQRIAEDLRKQTFLSFWSSLPSGSFGTSLAWIFRIAKMSVIMDLSCHHINANLICYQSHTETPHRGRSEFSTSHTRGTLLSVPDVKGRPAWNISSPLTHISLKALCHLKTAACNVLSSLNTWQIILNVYLPNFYKTTQNLMAYRFVGSIFTNFQICT